jgi:hypothetical protein
MERTMSEIDEIQAMLAKQLAGGQGDAKTSAGGPQIPQTKLAPTPAAPHPDEGKQLEIHGVAEDAMLGAVVVTDDGRSYFVEGLAEWDDALRGRRVVVTGVMARRKLAPDPTIAADGSVSHGMKGSASLLTGATWHLE